MIKIFTVSVVYSSPGRPRPFISGDSFLVHSEDELHIASGRFLDKFQRDGFEILNTLYIEITDAMIAAAVKDSK